MDKLPNGLGVITDLVRLYHDNHEGGRVYFHYNLTQRQCDFSSISGKWCESYHANPANVIVRSKVCWEGTNEYDSLFTIMLSLLL